MKVTKLHEVDRYFLGCMLNPSLDFRGNRIAKENAFVTAISRNTFATYYDSKTWWLHSPSLDAGWIASFCPNTGVLAVRMEHMRTKTSVHRANVLWSALFGNSPFHFRDGAGIVELPEDDMASWKMMSGDGWRGWVLRKPVLWKKRLFERDTYVPIDVLHNVGYGGCDEIYERGEDGAVPLLRFRKC